MGNALFEPILQCVSRYTATRLVFDCFHTENVRAVPELIGFVYDTRMKNAQVFTCVCDD